MDNTFFTGMTTSVSGVLTLALTSAAVIAAVVLGAIVGYRLYKRFTK